MLLMFFIFVNLIYFNMTIVSPKPKEDKLISKLKFENKKLENLKTILLKLNEKNVKLSEVQDLQRIRMETESVAENLEFDFETSKNSRPQEIPENDFEPAFFPNNPKGTVKQQDSTKNWSLTFITYIRNVNDFHDVKKLMESISKYSPLSFLLIGSSLVGGEYQIQETNRITFILFDESISLGKLLNNLLKSTKTYLGLIMKPSSFISEHTKLEHIFDAFSNTDAVIVSGANRDIVTGELYLPCFRIFLDRWTYQIEYGFSSTIQSKNQSPLAICQRTELPMAIKISELKPTHQFDEKLKDDDLVFEEFYIKMALHIKSLVSPYSMFHVKRKQIKSTNKVYFVDKWMPLAKKYKFDNIIGLNGNEKRIFLCREDWTLAFHHFNFMSQFLFTPTCNCNSNSFLKIKDQLYHIFFRYLVEFFEKRNVNLRLIGSGDNLGLYQFGSFNPLDADLNVVLDTSFQKFKQDFIPILSKKFQVDILNENHVNLKPTIWGQQFKELGNNVLISLRFEEKPFQHSFVKVDGKLIAQPFEPFQVFLKNFGNSYFEVGKQKQFQQSEGDNCARGKFFHDNWFDFGGKGESKPSGKIMNHPACVDQKQGSYFDNLPCPCNKLTHGLN
jgi:hypothetical protein